MKRKITDISIFESSFFGGFIIMIKTEKAAYWHTPEEENTYGVLDSEYPTVYKTQSDAQKRVNVVMYGD